MDLACIAATKPATRLVRRNTRERNETVHLNPPFVLRSVSSLAHFHLLDYYHRVDTPLYGLSAQPQKSALTSHYANRILSQDAQH